NPKVTEIGDCVFRICWIDPFQARLMAKFAAQVLRVKHIGILYDITSDYSTGLTNEFEDEAKLQGAEVVKKASYSAGDTDFSAQLTSIQEKNPDAIYIPAYYNEAGLIVRQARNMGIDSYLIGGDGWDAPQIEEVAGDKLNGSYYSAHFFPEDPAKAVKTFVT